MRTYTFDDVRSLIGQDSSTDYTGEVDDAIKENGKKDGYYILGYAMK